VEVRHRLGILTQLGAQLVLFQKFGPLKYWIIDVVSYIGDTKGLTLSKEIFVYEQGTREIREKGRWGQRRTTTLNRQRAKTHCASYLEHWSKKSCGSKEKLLEGQ